VGWERVRDGGEGRELLTVEGVRGGASRYNHLHVRAWERVAETHG